MNLGSRAEGVFARDTPISCPDSLQDIISLFPLKFSLLQLFIPSGLICLFCFIQIYLEYLIIVHRICRGCLICNFAVREISGFLKIFVCQTILVIQKLPLVFKTLDYLLI